MTIQRMDHVGIVVDDLAAATAFFVELGLKLQGEGPVEGGWVERGGARGRPGGDRDGGDPGRPRTARADEVSRPVGPGRRPARADEHPGIRHVAFAVADIDAVVASLRARGAEGIIVELAEQIG